MSALWDPWFYDEPKIQGCADCKVTPANDAVFCAYCRAARDAERRSIRAERKAAAVLVSERRERTVSQPATPTAPPTETEEGD